MGWGRTLLLGDIGNRMDIADTEEEIRRIKRGLSGSFSKDQSQDAKLESLARENAELKLYLASVIRILNQRDIISQDQLQAMVSAIDAEDGKIDGRADGDAL